MSSIDKKLTFQVIVWSLLIGLLFSGIQMVADYRSEQRNFTRSADELLTRSASIASLALYNYDSEALRVELQAIMSYPGLIGARIKEISTDYQISEGSIDSSERFVSFSIDLREPAKYSVDPQIIGSLTIIADRDRVTENFERRALVTLATDLERYATLAIVLLLVFRMRLTAPIRRLTHRLLEVDIHDPAPVTLEVEEPLQGTELDDLTSKMNDLISAMNSEMKQRVAAEHKAHQLNEHLEEKVHARTRELHETNHNLQTSLEQLQKMQGLLLQAQRMASLGHLAAGVAHEINNPVAVVYSNIATLSEYLTELIELADEYQKAEDTIADADIRMNLENMREGIDLAFVRDDGPDLIRASKQSLERVRNIVSELRTFADSDSLEREPANLSELLMEVVNESGLSLLPELRVVSLIDDLPEVDVVRSQVKLVLGKILENAHEAMPEGGVIEVAGETHDGTLTLVIKDTGIGMNKEQVDNAINPFYTGKEVGEGTGLGLTVAYNLMINQGGELSISSQEGEGTVVQLTFPLDNVLFGD